ncbi:MAG TPA: hypothetical protein VJQ57_15805 [Acidimicrobiia bacterium]|nr:hypothetical protein [Acidimicrobiia bacterium]
MNGHYRSDYAIESFSDAHSSARFGSGPAMCRFDEITLACDNTDRHPRHQIGEKWCLGRSEPARGGALR